MPDLERLIACVESMAIAAGIPPADPSAVRAYLEEMLSDVWEHFTMGLITHEETRDKVMFECARWLSHRSRVREPSSIVWSTDELQQSFDRALFVD